MQAVAFSAAAGAAAAAAGVPPPAAAEPLLVAFDAFRRVTAQLRAERDALAQKLSDLEREGAESAAAAECALPAETPYGVALAALEAVGKNRELTLRASRESTRSAALAAEAARVPGLVREVRQLKASCAKAQAAALVAIEASPPPRDDDGECARECEALRSRVRALEAEVLKHRRRSSSAVAGDQSSSRGGRSGRSSRNRAASAKAAPKQRSSAERHSRSRVSPLKLSSAARGEATVAPAVAQRKRKRKRRQSAASEQLS